MTTYTDAFANLNNWTQVRGIWSAVSGEARQTHDDSIDTLLRWNGGAITTPTYKRIAGNLRTGNANYYPALAFGLPSSGTTTAAITGYTFSLIPGFGWEVAYDINGVYQTDLAQWLASPPAVDTNYVVEVIHNSATGSIICKVDGVERINFTDTSYTGTGVGLLAWRGQNNATACHFDNWIYEDVAAGGTHIPATIMTRRRAFASHLAR